MRSQANGLRPHFSLRRIKNILLRKPPSREFARSALTQRQVKKARHIERKRNIPPKKYGVYTLHFSRGILHYVQNDVFFHPPGRLPQSLRSFAKTNKKVRHIERKRNIPPKKYGVYTLHFSRGILHFVQNDVFFHPPGRLPQSLRSFAKTVSASKILLLVLYQFEQVTQAVEIVAGEIIYVNSSAIVVAYRRNFRAEIALHALDQIS